MRIAIINWSRRKVGGVETYLCAIIPELQRLGHSLAFWHEVNEPANREQICLSEDTPAWCVSDLGTERALALLRSWHPDLLYSHGLLSPKLEAETLKVAPAVFFAHAYYGTCISGAKTFKKPIVTPCNRRFGWRCLVHYYPHRCGGWSPLTMVREYRRQSRRLAHLLNYQAIMTHSEHMRSEYIKHGFAADSVYNISSHAHLRDSSDPVGIFQCPNNLSLSVQARMTHEWRLLFVGRMDLLKGGRTFLDALPLVRTSLDRPLHVTFVGHGPDRRTWERKAVGLQAEDQQLHVEFAGWVNHQQLDSFWEISDLLGNLCKSPRSDR